MRVLLTGFGPFPGVPENISALMAARVAERARAAWPGIAARAAVLETTWAGAGAALDALIREHRPHIALHFGVSRDARGFEIETRAHNRMTARQDALAAEPDTPEIAPGGPRMRRARLPWGAVMTALAARRLPARLSCDAGSYLCNLVLYRSLGHAHTRPMPRYTGFVHIPAALQGVRMGRRVETAGGAAMGLEDAVQGGLAIVAACLSAAHASA